MAVKKQLRIVSEMFQNSALMSLSVSANHRWNLDTPCAKPLLLPDQGTDGATLGNRFGIVSELFEKPMPMHSTTDIAKRLGCTVQAVNKYRRKVEKQIGQRLGTPDPTDGRRTLYSADEVSQIAEMAPKIPVTPAGDDDLVEAELIEGTDTSVAIPPRRNSLALRHPTLPATYRPQFDLADANQATADIEVHTAHTAQRADTLLSDFAVTEMLGAVADIKQTVATLKANALGDATAQLGKQTGSPPAVSG